MLSAQIEKQRRQIRLSKSKTLCIAFIPILLFGTVGFLLFMNARSEITQANKQRRLQGDSDEPPPLGSPVSASDQAIDERLGAMGECSEQQRQKKRHRGNRGGKRAKKAAANKASFGCIHPLKPPAYSASKTTFNPQDDFAPGAGRAGNAPDHPIMPAWIKDTMILHDEFTMSAQRMGSAPEAPVIPAWI